MLDLRTSRATKPSLKIIVSAGDQQYRKRKMSGDAQNLSAKRASQGAGAQASAPGLTYNHE